MKKRIVTAVFAALICLSMTGCGGTTTQTAQPDGGSAAVVQNDGAIPAGTYSAEFDTDSAMFHVNETCDGMGKLTVAEDGGMTIHVTLVSKNIVNLYAGLAEDAKQAADGDILQPTTDEVTYDDGYTEEVYGFDIPVPALDEEFDVALVGKKGTWYDHKVTVSLAEQE